MPQIDYLPVATGGGANVDSQAGFAGSGYQTQGFTAGVAKSAQANKVWRQSSMVAAAIANFIANVLSINVVDDGLIANLITNLTRAIFTGAFKNVVVAFSSTPVFDASLGTDFEITLTANVTSSTLINTAPGMVITFIIHQDGVGSRSFVAPANAPLAAIDPGANKTSVQAIKFAFAQAYAFTPMTVT